MIAENIARQVGLKLKEKGYKLVTAESCTGGGIAYAVTQIEGSSAWFDRGFVTYTNEAKQEMLNVDQALLATAGAVSEAVALAMAKGALANSQADVSIAVTGVAGPTGGTPLKPVGTVWLAFASQSFAPQAVLLSLSGERAEIREQAVSIALERLLSLL
ncbi:MAG: CinA family protein [Candidatus Berkiella sp.]